MGAIVNGFRSVFGDNEMCRRVCNDHDQLEKDKKALSICRRDRGVTRTQLDDALTVHAEAKPSKLIDKKN